jgi:prevent-host-death family protein
MIWKLAEAKNRFSELINLSLAGKPQEVTRRNDAVIIISKSDYDKLTGTRPDFKTYLTEGADFSDLPLERDRSPMREVIL